MRQETHLAGEQKQKLLLTQAMTQSFHVLQLPVLELAEWLSTEIEQNPALEWEESKPDEISEHYTGPSVTKTAAEDLSIPHTESLFGHLMSQAQQHFFTNDERAIAELIIGNLDERGFLPLNFADLAKDYPDETVRHVLAEIQTFDPSGIGARDLQECLLIQLRYKQKGSSLAYTLIKEHFSDLLHNRLPLIQKQIGCPLEEISHAIKQDIAGLNLHPGAHFNPIPIQPLIPDIEILKENDTWRIEINRQPLPKFRLSPSYAGCVKEASLSPDEKKTLRSFTNSGKSLLEGLRKRTSTLQLIAEILLKHHRHFLSGESTELLPLTMQETAEMLFLSESTIARAISHKYLSCPRGIFPLRTFFSQAFKKAESETISIYTAKNLLKKMIEEEDKKHPLSDEQLAIKMGLYGIPCARRTIAKYRHLLKIGPASHRRKW